jgi:hypothetical protein
VKKTGTSKNQQGRRNSGPAGYENLNLPGTNLWSFLLEYYLKFNISTIIYKQAKVLHEKPFSIV